MAMRGLGWVAIVAACLACNAEVVTGSPWEIVPSTSSRGVDKVDLLFAIDNSSSMADKQTLLASAIPAFLGRLLNPNCVDENGANPVPGDDANCTTIVGTHPEFPAVHDLHIGVVSSSLGGATPDGLTCPMETNDPTHQNDQGHLVNRGLDGKPIANAQPVDNNGGNFLAWLPSANPFNANKQPPNVTPYTNGNAKPFVGDFASLVAGVGQTGCGLEAQLESWYRFLIQPDPYNTISFTTTGVPQASLEDVDATLLKMRHDFLRPDSLVAIIQLTDEEDSWSDPMWLGGYGWTTRSPNFPGGPSDSSGVGPRGTSDCDAPIDFNTTPPSGGPNDPNCVSCAFPQSNKPNGQLIGDDPNCNSCAPGATTCAKPGWYSAATPATPITAADGLNVRYGSQYTRQRYGFDAQHSVLRYIDGLTSTSVPDSAHEVDDAASYSSTVRNCTNPLFAGELPDGSDTSSGALCNLPEGPRTPSLVFYALLGGVPNDLIGNWTAIVGKDPAHYDFTGIDPRMIESTSPRAGQLDDWNTLTSPEGIDLEYACTFTLPTPHDCSAGNDPSCECNGVAGGPPLCDPQNPKTQILGKAYPTSRELRVAQGLDSQAVVASICPTDANGYVPAMNRIVDAMKRALVACEKPIAPLCELIDVDTTSTNQAAGCNAPGLSQPSAPVLAAVKAPAVVCVVNEVECSGSAPGWCIGGTSTCERLAFSSTWTQPPGTELELICPVTGQQ
jgi:hypothetical protein